MRLRRIVNIVAMILIAVALRRLLASASFFQSFGRSPLDRTVDAIEFGGVPFDSAVATLSSKWGMPIDVEPEAKRLLGNDTVKCQISRCTMSEALHVLCGSTIHVVTYSLDRGRVRITTPNRAPLLVRIYDVRDLYQKMVNDYPANEDPRYPPPTRFASNVAIFGGVGALPPPPKSTRQQAIEKEAMQNITAWLQDTVTPDFWASAGGIGSIKGKNGFVIVLQTPEGHQLIQRLLANVRRVDVVRWKRDSEIAHR